MAVEGIYTFDSVENGVFQLFGPELNALAKERCCCSSVVEHVLGKDGVMGSNPISSP
jgi:hypothetical protein